MEVNSFLTDSVITESIIVNWKGWPHMRSAFCSIFYCFSHL